MAVNNKKRNNNNWHNNLQLGDHLYYSAFISNNSGKVKAFVNTTKEALSPYHDFLNEAIKAEDTKGSYECDWEKVESNHSLIITPIYSTFKVEKPKTIFKVYIEDLILKETDNKLIFDDQDEIIRFDKSTIKIEDNCMYFDIEILPRKDEVLEVNKEEVKYELIDLSLELHDELTNNNETFKIEKIEVLENGWKIGIKPDKNLKELTFSGQKLNVSKYTSSFEKLFDGDVEYKYESLGNEYKSEILPKSKVLIDETGTKYKWRENRNSNKQDIVIQLIDDDSNDDKLTSEYFFEDDVKNIYQGKDSKNSFNVKVKKQDDKILILGQDWNNPKQLKDGEPIKIQVNTGNLKKQRDSIKLLNNQPVKSQKNLIKLFEKKSPTLWKQPISKDITDWYILKDENYDGTLDQREFVKKAIATDDFAILEGPPGSGKTTTILELILQLTKEGKKVLLSASTHVAIDNVLERIDEYDTDKTVEALRIGKIESVGESIKDLQIDTKIKTYRENGLSQGLAESLVLDSANLVCGTTMGINQFPPIKDRVTHENGKRKDSLLPMDPMFDVMIIDESSKTTFQEFLVPAMLAKKWILVGDIKQLSPFIEQSHIVHNLNVSVDKHVQKAIRLIFETLHNNKNPYIVEVSIKEEQEIKKYLDAWASKEKNPYSQKVVCYSDEKDLFKKIGSDLILIREGSWESVKKYLPKTHIVILKKDSVNDNFWFQQNYLNHKNKLEKFGKINTNISKNNTPIEYQDFFNSMLKEQNWAEAIAWRMIRVYERRMLKNPDSYFEKSYELLKPIGANSDVDGIYNMTLPSILESIQAGNGEKHRNSTTITEGFDKRDLDQRHETLKTQHRMHPDISQFSREEFYTVDGVQALKDSRRINREWDYGEYNSHAVWIDAPKSANDKNNDRRHVKEVKIIIDEITKFLKFTKREPINEEKEAWNIAVLSFYKPQETLLREALRKLCDQPNTISKFSKGGTEILLYTVDKFQGMEADIVFLSMVRGSSVGFMDNINRLNVALTRAKYQRVIVGDKNFFSKQNSSQELKRLAENEGK
jgi:hypothetical protein